MRPGRPANAHVSSSLKGPRPLEAGGPERLTAREHETRRKLPQVLVESGGI